MVQDLSTRPQAPALEDSVKDAAVGTPRVVSRVPIPFLIKCGCAFMALWAVTMYVTAAVVLVGAAIDAVLNGVRPVGVIGDELLGASWFTLLMVVSGPFAWGVWKERAWTRHVAMAFWIGWMLIVMGGMILEPHSDDARMLLYGLICACIAVWYFYRKPSVVLYYDQLRARGRGA